MYISGVIVAFIISFIVLSMQATKRKQLGEDSNNEIIGVIFGSAIYSILSWLTVAIMIIMLLGGKAWGVSDKNL